MNAGGIHLQLVKQWQWCGWLVLASSLAAGWCVTVQSGQLRALQPCKDQGRHAAPPPIATGVCRAWSPFAMFSGLTASLHVS